MSEIEKIERYIELTNATEDRGCHYQMLVYDMIALLEKAGVQNQSVSDAISLAFEYGKAKGYRKARKEFNGTKFSPKFSP